jgi:hypothetical protein
MPLWGKSRRRLRSLWRTRRRQVLAERGLVRAHCGVVEAESGRLNLHEVWRYDADRSPAVARLAGLELLCRNYHGCEHFGRLPREAEAAVIDHFCRVNGLTRADFRRDHRAAMVLRDERNRLDWAIDWGEFADPRLPTGPFRAASVDSEEGRRCAAPARQVDDDTDDFDDPYAGMEPAEIEARFWGWRSAEER